MIGIRNIRSFFLQGPKSKISNYLLSIIVIVVTSLACTPLANTENYSVVSFILLFVVSILSTFMGIGPILMASTISALAWNFFFIPPQFTFHIEKTEDILIFGLFYIIAFVNGVLTSRVRNQEKLIREREKRTNALFQLTKGLSKSSGIEEILDVASHEIQNQFGLKSFFILQDGNNILDSRDRLRHEAKLSPDEFKVAEWVFKHAKTAGVFTANSFDVDLTFFPMQGTKLNPGTLAVKLSKPFLDEQKTYWETFITQICNALEREFLGEMAQKVRLLDESDRLYKTLFNSISHELRIPVATIMGASDSILHSTNANNIQSALNQEIFTASIRLNRLIENLLNMSRLESGHISVRLDWYDINDLINKVMEDLNDELKIFSLQVTIPANMPLVKIDFGLIEQVLYNLLFNSTQYAPAASVIELNSNYENGMMILEVIDQGPGFRESDLQYVFKKFFRVDSRKTGGLGLGLSIVKGFVEAHNGKVMVDNIRNGGAKFTIAIPTEQPEINNI
jgi:two-component system sensor histidine kinase KdpD